MQSQEEKKINIKVEADLIKKDPLKIAAAILILLALSFGFYSRVVSVFSYNTFDIGVAPDQARDGFVYMNMWKGIWPSLGGESSVGGYHLLPLYFYLVFPFTIFGPDPVFQALPNGLFSFLSIPLLMYLIYQLLENVEISKRIFLAGIAGFWYSLIYPEIFISNFHWQPSPIPFFLLCLTLLYKWQLEAKLPAIAQAFCWIFYGIILAILVSLHSTAMFVIPVVFAGSCIYFVSKKYKNVTRWLLPALSIIATNITLAHYWKGEINRNWTNTKRILATVSHAGDEAHVKTLWERISRIFFNYFELGQQAYFIGDTWFNVLISIIFFSVILTLAIAKFRGNKTLLTFLMTTWIIYLYAASNYGGVYLIHYKLLILFAPIILTVVSLAYLDYSRKTEKLVSLFLIAGIVLSAAININHDYKFVFNEYGKERLVSTADNVFILNQLPQGATICDPQYKSWRVLYSQYKYIDTYITKRRFQYVKHCKAGNYLLQPKFSMVVRGDHLFPVFSITKNQAPKAKSSLYLETPVANVYVLEETIEHWD